MTIMETETVRQAAGAMGGIAENREADVMESGPALSRRGACIAALAACAGLALPGAGAFAAPSLQDGAIAETVRKMKPGEYLWAPDVAPDGPVLVIVSLDTQRAYVYRNGLPIGISTVSTGKSGHETPTGIFTVLQKAVDHKSNLYNSAPMPFMQRLTWDGIAMHAGNLPGYPASHGCIRLPTEFARLLYGVTRLGLTVVITDEADVPRVAPTPALFLSARGKDRDAPDPTPAGDRLWAPERSPSGPISIVISAADRRLIVLRNGITIGSTPVSIKGEVTGPAAYTLRAVDAGGFHWMRLTLPGQKLEGDPAVSPEERDRLRLPEDFRRALAAILTPGTTVVVTPDTLQGGGTGTKLTVMTGDEEEDSR